MENFKPVKSVYTSNLECIRNIMELYKIDRFDLDCTYSKGNFWKNLPEPIYKSDLFPVNDHVIQSNSENLPFLDNSMNTIMYDPPFIVSGKTYKENKQGSSIIAKRFEGYDTYDKLLNNYYLTLSELYRICNQYGFVVVKCQDTISGGRQYLTHVNVINMGFQIGFYPKDLFILTNNVRLNSFGGKWKKQMHARKYHSYFLVFEKIKPKVSYNLDKIIKKQNFVENLNII